MVLWALQRTSSSIITLCFIFFYNVPVSRWNGLLLFLFRDAKVEVKKGEMISLRLCRWLVAGLGQKFYFSACQCHPLFFICLLHPITQCSHLTLRFHAEAQWCGHGHPRVHCLAAFLLSYFSIYHPIVAPTVALDSHVGRRPFKPAINQIHFTLLLSVVFEKSIF